jgi:predicted aspartyl protease
MTSLAAALALTLAAAGFPASHAASGAQDAGTTDVVAAGQDAHERMTVPVHIGANGPYRFLLDTGAQNTVVSVSLAGALALPAGARATVIGVAGSQSVPTVELDEILLGRRSFYGLRAPLLERRDIGADGILGLDSLQGQRVLLDFRRGLVAIDDARALGGDGGYEIVVRARRRSGQLIMTDATIDGVRTDVVVDTGADFTIGNRALQRALQRTAGRRTGEQAVLNSVTGQQVLADVGMARRLDIAGLSLRSVGIAFADAPPFAALDLERRPALLLGMRELRAFRRVAIDFSSRKILFDLPAGE